ncbi:hypothetical protein BH23PLA1_BH23PLA1_13860 [soil metagenome]
MKNNHSKSILLTGASAGLGAAIARELALRGHQLAIVARRADSLQSLAEDVQAVGGEALALVADLADPETPEFLVSATSDRFGGIDVLINNAAFGLPDYFGAADPEGLRRQMTVNLTAPLLLARLALPHLIESKGVIINIGSAVTRVANPIFGAYGTTKAALSYWSDALRRELRHRGVRVCLVELGPLDTDFFQAVSRLEAGGVALGVGPPTDAIYNAMRDRPPACLTISAESAAHQIARLVERPRARVAIPRRVVWPMRFLGALLGLAPGLADLTISAMIHRVDRERQKERRDQHFFSSSC